MSDTRKLLTLAQAAELSACSTKALRRAIDAGQLQACRLGQSARSDRIHPNDLSTWWAQSRVATPQLSLPAPSLRPPRWDSADDRVAEMLGVRRPRAKPLSRRIAATTRQTK